MQINLDKIDYTEQTRIFSVMQVCFPNNTHDRHFLDERDKILFRVFFLYKTRIRKRESERRYIYIKETNGD
jgi:hypothetical protein